MIELNHILFLKTRLFRFSVDFVIAEIFVVKFKKKVLKFNMSDSNKWTTEYVLKNDASLHKSMVCWSIFGGCNIRGQRGVGCHAYTDRHHPTMQVRM